MNKEIEIRAIVNNRERIEKRLVATGFIPTNEVEQLDIMMDKPDGSLFNSGRKIRLRIEGASGELTYKGMFEGDAMASRRVEINFGVLPKELNSITEFFSALGFPPLFTIPKRRTEYKRENITVTLDEWPIIGCLMELEGLESDIINLAKELCPSVKFRGYRLKELFLNKEAETGKSLIELQKDFEAKHGTKLGRLDLLLK